MPMHSRLFAACSLGLLAMPNVAAGQSATPGSVVTLEPMMVEGRFLDDLTIARERLQATPGGTAIVETRDIEGRANLTLSDSFETAQGVVIQDFFGGFDQPRIQIRGSGLQQNPVERGVLFLQDGLPLNRADGSYIVSLAEPRSVEFIEINRGYATNRLGATVLGGSLNFVSPTGSSQPGFAAHAEGGSFGHVAASASFGYDGDDIDGQISLSGGRRDGFRDFNASRRAGFDANLGVTWGDGFSTRFFAGYRDVRFDVAGPLTRELLEDDPSQNFAGPTITPTPMGPLVSNPGPNVLRDLPERDALQGRIGSRTTYESGDHVFDAAAGLTYTDDRFTFPIAGGVRDTEGGDVSIVGRYAWNPNPDAVLPLFETTLTIAVGQADRTYAANIMGDRGPVFGRNDLSATTISAFAGGSIPLGPGLTLSPGLALSYASRQNDDEFDGDTRPTVAFSPINPDVPFPDGSVPFEDTSYDRDFFGVSPSLAISWRPLEQHLFFAAVSRSFEPPTHDDLIATINGTPNSSPGRPNPGDPTLPAAAFATPDLDAQKATTVEIGWRGQLGPVAVDTVLYHSWVSNELLNLRDESGVSLGAFNADDTRHLGLEVGATSELMEGLVGRLSYTFQDFRFVGDPVRGDNRLAGAPPHVVGLDIARQPIDALTLGGTLNWRPGTTPVDNLNTVGTGPFATLDLRARYQLAPEASFFVEARNVTDEAFASSTLVVDEARADQAAFIPGDGRAIYAGLDVRF